MEGEYADVCAEMVMVGRLVVVCVCCRTVWADLRTGCGLEMIFDLPHGRVLRSWMFTRFESYSSPY